MEGDKSGDDNGTTQLLKIGSFFDLLLPQFFSASASFNSWRELKV
jgi:hypothetical protein